MGLSLDFLRSESSRGREKQSKPQKNNIKRGVYSGGAATYGGRPPRRHLRPPPAFRRRRRRNKEREPRERSRKREKASVKMGKI